MNRVTNLVKAIVAILIVVYLIGNDIGVIPDFSLWRALFSVLFALGIADGLYSKRVGYTLTCVAALYYTIQPVILAPKISIFILFISVCLLTIAFGYLFPNYKKDKFVKFSGSYYTDNEDAKETSNSVSITFGDIEKYIYTKQFENYQVQCTFGEVKLYFDNAEMLNEEATLFVSCNFGEITLFIPKDWRIDTKVSTVFADKAHVGNPDAPNKTLHIKGSMNFSELRVIYI